jgi:hypothetical protein
VKGVLALLQAKLEGTDGVKGPTAGTVVDSETEKRGVEL